jgi:hypothetical protein
MKLERTDTVVITLEGDEVWKFRDFLDNAIEDEFTSPWDAPLINALYEALSGKSKP